MTATATALSADKLCMRDALAKLAPVSDGEWADATTMLSTVALPVGGCLLDFGQAPQTFGLVG